MPKSVAENITFEKIRGWLNDSNAPALSELEKAIYERLDYAYDQLKIEPPSSVVSRLMRKFDISKNQAYRDIRDAQKLLNPINRQDLEWIRNFIIDDALLHIKVARERIDNRSWQKARADLIRIYAIEKSEKATIDPEMLGRNEYFVTINFGSHAEKINLNKLHELPDNRRIQLTDFLFADAQIEDVEFIMNS